MIVNFSVDLAAAPDICSGGNLEVSGKKEISRLRLTHWWTLSKAGSSSQGRWALWSECL